MEDVNVGNSLFLKAHGTRISAIVRQVELYHLQGGYGGSLNLKEISGVIEGSIKEIARLQQINDELVKALDQKEAQLSKLGETVSNG